jgi:hypothetical protein
VENESLNTSWAVVLGRLLVGERFVEDGTVDITLAVGVGLNNEVILALSASCMATSLVLFSDQRPRDTPFLVVDDGLKNDVQLEWKASCTMVSLLFDDAFVLTHTTAEVDRLLPLGFGLRNENGMVGCSTCSVSCRD